MSSTIAAPTADQVVDHFFRHESGRVVAHLTRVFGASNIEVIEDAVQDALFKAMQTWGFGKVPDNPGGWIMRVAKNRVIDLLRHNSLSQPVGDESLLEGTETETSPTLDHEVRDDQLRMMFACCDPELSAEVQVMLTLKLLGGFGTREIARALLKGNEAVVKAITRGKKRLRDSGIDTDPVSPGQLSGRLASVLQVLYLMFNEGYKASEGENLVRKDVCFEAMRLCQLLLQNPLCNQSHTHALMALMCYQASRLDARTGAAGELLTLEQQDRNQWDTVLIDIGNRHLELAAESGEPSAYQLQAGLAACHSNASSYENTDWPQILALYNALMGLNNSPVVALNRIVAVAKVHGATKALAALEVLPYTDELSQYHLFYAIRADLQLELGNSAGAAKDLRSAIALAGNDTERSFLENKLVRIEADF